MNIDFSGDDLKKRAGRIGLMIDDCWRLAERGGVQINNDDAIAVFAKRLRELKANAAGLSSEELHAQLDDIESTVRPMYDALVATRKRN